MGQYTVKLSFRAHDDMVEIFNSLTELTFDTELARRVTKRIYEKIKKLDTFPFQCPECEEPPLAGKGLRFLTVSGYNVLYTVNEDKKTVNIVRIYNAKRDPEGIITD